MAFREFVFSVDFCFFFLFSLKNVVFLERAFGLYQTLTFEGWWPPCGCRRCSPGRLGVSRARPLGSRGVPSGLLVRPLAPLGTFWRPASDDLRWPVLADPLPDAFLVPPGVAGGHFWRLSGLVWTTLMPSWGTLLFCQLLSF